MTDQQPFAPPPGFTPPPPVVGGPAPAPVPTPRTGAARPWVVPVVVLSSIAFVGLVVAVIVVVMIGTSGFLNVPTANPAPVVAPTAPADQPVGSGDAPCDGCFSAEDAETIVLDAERYLELGLLPSEGSDYFFELEADLRENVGWWNSDRGDPDSCFFTYPQAPLGFTLTMTPEPAVGDDPIVYPLGYTDENGWYALIQGSRVFDDPTAAAAHIAEIDTALVGCTQYALPVSGYAAVVDPARKLDLPAGVSAAGWVETSGPARFYAFDVQRANLVVRLTLNSDADGPSENEFRRFVEDFAQVLASAQPGSQP